MAALGLWTLNQVKTPGVSHLGQRFSSLQELAHPTGVPSFAVLYPRLFSGDTLYRYIPGSRSWLTWPAQGIEGWGLDVVLFWVLLAVAVWLLWKSWKAHTRAEDRVLISAWGLELAAFWFVAGPRGMSPGMERFAICLIGPTVVLLSRGTALWCQKSPRRYLLVLAGVSLLGWLVLADYQDHYFRFFQQTGGRSEATFRTAEIEPKQAALRIILKDRTPGPTWIVTGRWWNFWPLRYLAMTHNDLRVVTPNEAQASAEFRRAFDRGRVWFVEFSNSEELRQAAAMLSGKKIRRWELKDYGGRPVLCVLHGEQDRCTRNNR